MLTTDESGECSLLVGTIGCRVHATSSRSRTSEGSRKAIPRAVPLLMFAVALAAVAYHAPQPLHIRSARHAAAIAVMPTVDAAERSAVESNPIFTDDKKMLAEASFAIPPEDLIFLAKRFLASRGGFGADPKLLADNFNFIGPVVGPLSKDAFIGAIASVDIATGFPDFEPQFHNFRVDPFEGDRVWYTARGRGTNTGPLPPFSPAATGKSLVNPPQACSLTFNDKGEVIKYTIGYVMDRDVGNTGGLGGLYGIMYAIGKPLPFPEAQPWKMSKRYRAFNAVGNFVTKFATPKDD